MKVYQFPKRTRKLQKKQKKQDPIVGEEHEAASSKESLTDIMKELEGWIKDQENPAEQLDASDIDPEQFQRFCDSFPCMDALSGKKAQELLGLYGAGTLTSQQNIVVEFLFELLSPYNFGFDISDAFLVLDRKDRRSLIEVLSIYENSLN